MVFATVRFIGASIHAAPQSHDRKIIVLIVVQFRELISPSSE